MAMKAGPPRLIDSTKVSVDTLVSVLSLRRSKSAERSGLCALCRVTVGITRAGEPAPNRVPRPPREPRETQSNRASDSFPTPVGRCCTSYGNVSNERRPSLLFSQSLTTTFEASNQAVGSSSLVPCRHQQSEVAIGCFRRISRSERIERNDSRRPVLAR